MKRTVIPALGKRVLYPDQRLALAGGENVVDWNTYWERRLRDGDITIVSVPASASDDTPAAAAPNSTPRKRAKKE